MVRLIAIIILTTIMLCGGNAAAQGGKTESGRLGLGIIVGEPTGLSLKGWIGDALAIDGAVAWSFGNNAALQLHADCLFHKFDLFGVKKGKLPLYYGIGGRFKFDGDDRVGVRIPVGISYIFANDPLDIFVEVAPMLNLVPATEFDINGAIGVRFFF